jgi:alpha-tubulin suppressor-like RCC1 family protein
MRTLPTRSTIAVLVASLVVVAGCGNHSSSHVMGDASIADGNSKEKGETDDAPAGFDGNRDDSAAADAPPEEKAEAAPGPDADARPEHGAELGNSSNDARVDSVSSSGDSTPEARVDSPSSSGDSAAEASADAGLDKGGTFADAAVDSAPQTAVMLAAGSVHTCALLSNGTVECWGAAYHGQLGNGTTTGSAVCAGGRCSMNPVPVSGLTGVIAIAAGAAHTCALLSNHTVKCWGLNTFGQLGDGMSTGPETCTAGGTYGCSSLPVVVTGLSGVTAITAGHGHTCALFSGGTVECWGDNAYGELGNGSCTGPQQCANTDGAYACSTTPVVVPGLSGVTAIAAGDEGTHTCALLSGGSVECWGSGEMGALGNGMTVGPQTCTWGSFNYTAFTTPVAVSGLSGATSVAAGQDVSCALVSGGGIACWGANYLGQLGDGTATGPQKCSMVYACSTTPVGVSGLASPAISVVTGGADTCALLSNGTVECWGTSVQGGLGVGADAGMLQCDFGSQCSTVPVAVSGLTGVTSLVAGAEHTCALEANGSVWCWGNNTTGQVGSAAAAAAQTPVRVLFGP